METRSLWVGLDDEQVEARSRQLARALLDLGDKERDLDEFRATMRETIKARVKILEKHRGEVDALAEAVDNRRERSSVECDWRYNLAAGTKYLLRRDTGGAVEKYSLTDKERQLAIGESAPDLGPKPTVKDVQRWEGDLAAIAAAAEAEGEAA